MSIWFKPNWASRSVGGAGPDPEAVGCFFNLGEWSDPPVRSFWSLFEYDYHDASGTVIGFNSYTNGAAYGAGAVMANFRSNQWHQIVVTYSPSSVITWIDGTNAASASGCNIVPDKATRDYGFFIGSDTGGNQQAQGSYDLLETFNYPLSASQIGSNYLYTIQSGQGFGAQFSHPSAASPIP